MVKGWEIFVRNAYDSKLFQEIFVTGSNSLFLNSEHSTLLSDRSFGRESHPILPRSKSKIISLTLRNNNNPYDSERTNIKRHKKIENPGLLNQLFSYLRLIKRTENKAAGNKDAVLKFAGILSRTEAEQLQKSISENFNSIEGEW